MMMIDVCSRNHPTIPPPLLPKMAAFTAQVTVSRVQVCTCCERTLQSRTRASRSQHTPDCLLSLYNTAPQTRPARAAVRVHASAAPEAVPSRRAMVASLLAGASSPVHYKSDSPFFPSAVPRSR
jgi:hypothetical protein